MWGDTRIDLSLLRTVRRHRVDRLVGISFVEGSVRYWFDQADEDLDRELERRRHLGLCVLQSDNFPKWVIGFSVLVFLPGFLAMG